MVAANRTSGRFPHRKNDDGTFDSICPVCFRTVARAHREEELTESERNHSCEPRVDVREILRRYSTPGT